MGGWGVITRILQYLERPTSIDPLQFLIAETLPLKLIWNAVSMTTQIIGLVA